MEFGLEDKELPIITVFDLADHRFGSEYPTHDDGKCNLHMVREEHPNGVLSIVPQSTKRAERKERVKKPLEEWQLAGHWSAQERKRYHWFLEIHHLHYLRKELRRTDKIFKSMAVFVGTRAADQCRSHHQKMEKKHRGFLRILCSLRQAHYNSLEVAEMKEDMAAHGVECDSKLLDPFPTEDMLREEGRDEPREVHYNFFGDDQLTLKEEIERLGLP